MEHFRRIARAFADADPAFSEIAREELDDLEAKIASLRAQGTVIRSMLILAANARVVPAAEGGSPPGP